MSCVKLDFHVLNQFSTLAEKGDGIGDGLKMGRYLHFSFNERLEVVSSELKIVMMILICRGFNSVDSCF